MRKQSGEQQKESEIELKKISDKAEVSDSLIKKPGRDIKIDIPRRKHDIDGQLSSATSPPSSFPHEINSPLSPLEKCATALEIKTDEAPVVNKIKIDNNIYLVVAITNMALGIINSSAAGLGIYSVLTEMTENGGFGIAISPLSGGILAFVTTGALFAGMTYTSCMKQIKTITNLMQDVQLISTQKQSIDKRLNHQKIRFLRNILVLHQQIMNNGHQADQMVLTNKLGEYFENNNDSFEIKIFTKKISELYHSITDEKKIENGLLTPDYFRKYLSSHPQIVSDFFIEQKTISNKKTDPKSRGSFCLKLSSHIFLSASSVINFLGTTTLIATQAVKMTGLTMPVKAVIPTAFLTVINGFLTYMGQNHIEEKVHSLENHKQANQELNAHLEEKTSYFSHLANYAKLCSAELDQAALTEDGKQDKSQIELLKRQLAQEQEKNQAQERQIQKLMRQVKTLQHKETTTSPSRKYTHGSPSLLASKTERQPSPLNCTTRSPVIIPEETEKDSCIVC